MRISIQITKKDLGKLQELENATGLRKGSIVSLLIGEVYASYKCAKISGDYDFMPMALVTDNLKKKIRH